MVNPDDVVKFWLDEVGEKGWYAQSDALDAEIRERFKGAWSSARTGHFGSWTTYPAGALAYIILLDQFPRNMFRGDGTSFATDRQALSAAKASIGRGWDVAIDEPARQFFYLPLMHSENLPDQDRCIRLICDRMPETGDGTLLHAQAHREVIREFGRFPYRNAALERKSTPSEIAYLKAGGYSYTVRKLQQKTAA
ncbi:DUF924 family protein [Roseovarius dicentrarchi]|uniref:DUF924 family protein n=1 Tax=Roseovarius dicentrarchi TaxID=2250573 RepID=UPI000DEA1073|nr:DUF924 family protein [Roseovarius dicentrarchi]